jgi:putative transposase
MAESFVDTFKCELISDRVWRSCSQGELAIVEWVGWYNQTRLHDALGDVPTAEFEQARLAAVGATDRGRRRDLPPTQPLRCPQPEPNNTVSVEPGPAHLAGTGWLRSLLGGPQQRSSRLSSSSRLPLRLGRRSLRHNSTLMRSPGTGCPATP